MRIGLVQTRGIGDIIIALPIAQSFVNDGHEVFWPIDSRFVSSFQAAALREVARGLPIVEIRSLTDSVFDWLRVIERASCLLMIDSCYANLVEQLGIQVRKCLWVISVKYSVG